VKGTWEPKRDTVYAVLSKYVYGVGEQGEMKVSATLEDAAHLSGQDKTKG
jgi:hypothetical protein